MEIFLTVERVVESIEKGNLTGLTIARDILGDKWGMVTPKSRVYLIERVNKIKRDNKLNEAIFVCQS